MATPPKCDWEEVEKRYRTNQGSIRSIAKEFGISDSAIRKRIKKEGWTRDLAEDFQRELKNRQLEQLGTRYGTQCEPSKSKQERDSDRDTINNAVDGTMEVINKQIGRIDRLNNSIDNMLIELEKDEFTYITKDGVELKDSKAKTDYMRTLSQAIERSIKLERQAYNIGDDGQSKETSLSVHVTKKEDLKQYSIEELQSMRESLK